MAQNEVALTPEDMTVKIGAIVAQQSRERAASVAFELRCELYQAITKRTKTQLEVTSAGKRIAIKSHGEWQDACMSAIIDLLADEVRDLLMDRYADEALRSMYNDARLRAWAEQQPDTTQTD